jgi:hypothetical protein
MEAFPVHNPEINKLSSRFIPAYQVMIYVAVILTMRENPTRMMALRRCENGISLNETVAPMTGNKKGLK